MEKDEKVIIKTTQFSRELLEKMYADLKKNEALRTAADKEPKT